MSHPKDTRMKRRERKNTASSLINKGNTELRIEQIMSKLGKPRKRNSSWNTTPRGDMARTPESKQDDYEHFLKWRDANVYGGKD